MKEKCIFNMLDLFFNTFSCRSQRRYIIQASTAMYKLPHLCLQLSKVLDLPLTGAPARDVHRGWCSSVVHRSRLFPLFWAWDKLETLREPLIKSFLIMVITCCSTHPWSSSEDGKRPRKTCSLSSYLFHCNWWRNGTSAGFISKRH